MPSSNSKKLKKDSGYTKREWKWLECCTCHERITAENFWTHNHNDYIDKSDCPRAIAK